MTLVVMVLLLLVFLMIMLISNVVLFCQMRFGFFAGTACWMRMTRKYLSAREPPRIRSQLLGNNQDEITLSAMTLAGSGLPVSLQITQDGATLFHR